MKKLNLYLVTLILVCFTACDSFSSKKAYDSYDSYVSGKSETIRKVEPEKKSVGFYENLLEEFCLQYYSDCFPGRTYVAKSVVLLDLTYLPQKDSNGNVTHYNVEGDGIHSFEGRFGRRNTNSRFYFEVTEVENNCRVRFIKKKYDLFGDEAGSEEGTRTMHYN